LFLAVVLTSNVAMSFGALESLAAASVASFAWLGLFLAPFLDPFATWQRLAAGAQRLCPLMDRALPVAFVTVYCVIVYLLFPFFSGSLRWMNEWLNLPECTLVSGKYVDNLEYLNQHQLLGTHSRYDLRRDGRGAPEPSPAQTLRVPLSPALESFSERHPRKYYYDEGRGVLVVVGRVTPEEHVALRTMAKDATARNSVDDFWFSSNAVQDEWEARQLSSEERQFLFDNRIELMWQAPGNWMWNWMWHHHAYVLLPVFEYSAGKPLQEINTQYGWMNVVLLATVLEWLGGVTLQRYLCAWFGIYLLYYALFLGLTWMLLGRRPALAVSAALLACSGLSLMGFVALPLSPGWSPARHFLDVFVIFFFFQYVRYRSWKRLAAGHAVALVGLANEMTFGLALLAALHVATLGRAVLESKLPNLVDLVAVLVSALFAGLILMFGRVGTNHLLPYYLQGYMSQPLEPAIMAGLLLAAAAGYGLLWLSRGTTGYLRPVALLLLVYCQGLLVYYVWNTSRFHFLSLLPLMGLTMGVLLALTVEANPGFQRVGKLVGCSALALSTFVFVLGLGIYHGSRAQYERIFSTHQVHEWKFTRASIESTVDPAYFESAVQLLVKYAGGDDAVYIISKYDNIVPFLAGKYSAMPFFELSRFTITESEIQRSAELITRAKPRFLFVDTDVTRSFLPDAIDAATEYVGFLHGESVERALRLSALGEVFQRVKSQYELAEEGLLLSVYVRRDACSPIPMVKGLQNRAQ
jgi:hypothetical protein